MSLFLSMELMVLLHKSSIVLIETRSSALKTEGGQRAVFSPRTTLTSLSIYSLTKRGLYPSTEESN